MFLLKLTAFGIVAQEHTPFAQRLFLRIIRLCSISYKYDDIIQQWQIDLLLKDYHFHHRLHIFTPYIKMIGEDQVHGRSSPIVFTGSPVSAVIRLHRYALQTYRF